MDEPVIVAVPPKGGSLDDVLRRLARIGWVDGDMASVIRRLVKEDKRRVKLEEGLIHLWRIHGGDEAATARAADEAGHDLDDVLAALKRMRRVDSPDGSIQLGFTPKPGVDRLLQSWRHDPDLIVAEAATMLHLELDLGRPGRPTRMVFDHLEFEFHGVRGVLVGTEHEVTPTYLRRHKRDLSLTCYDAFHNTLLDALDTGNVRDWRELMDHLIEANTDVRILGSLGLGDFLGHFVLMPEERAKRTAAVAGNRRWGDHGRSDPKLALLAEGPVLVDANYELIYMNLLESEQHGIEFANTTEDIESRVAEGATAIYIVRSGGTIAATPGVCVVGEELVTSETIVAVNQERYDHNAGVAVLADSLEPCTDDRVDAWRAGLKDRLGAKLF